MHISEWPSDVPKNRLTLPLRRNKNSQSCAPAQVRTGCGHARPYRPRLQRRTQQQRGPERLHIIGATVCKWRERFRVQRLEGLLDEPRPGASRSITDAQVEEVVTKTLESMPTNSTHWSTRLMAQKTGLSQTAIVRIWRAFGLQPHRVENFKFSKD